MSDHVKEHGGYQRPTVKTRVSDGQLDLLGRIYNDEKHDGQDPVDHPVWTEEVCAGLGKSAGGLMAALIGQGLAWSDGETCGITALGAEIYLESLPCETQEDVERKLDCFLREINYVSRDLIHRGFYEADLHRSQEVEGLPGWRTNDFTGALYNLNDFLDADDDCELYQRRLMVFIHPDPDHPGLNTLIIRESCWDVVLRAENLTMEEAFQALHNERRVEMKKNTETKARAKKTKVAKKKASGTRPNYQVTLGGEPHSAVSIIRWFGSQELTKAQTMKIFAAMKEAGHCKALPNEATFGIQISAGRTGRIDPPKLKRAEISVLRGFVKAAAS